MSDSKFRGKLQQLVAGIHSYFLEKTFLEVREALWRVPHGMGGTQMKKPE